MSEKFPSLLFKLEYEEPGIAFKGRCSAQGGNILSSESHEMD